MGVFEAIVSIAQAIPIVNDWLQKFIAWYVESQIASMKKENADVIKRAVELHNQIDLEKLLGNKNAGEPTNLPGTELRDTLPGVPK